MERYRPVAGDVVSKDDDGVGDSSGGVFSYPEDGGTPSPRSNTSCRPFSDEEEDGVNDEETEADYRARIMHVDTFLRLNESISSLKEMSKTKPDYVADVRDILNGAGAASAGDAAPLGGERKVSVGIFENGNGVFPPPGRGWSARTADDATNGTNNDTVNVTVHAHLIYHGDLLQLSKETVKLVITKRDFTLFTRIVDCFKRMLLGHHTDDDVANMRRDHDSLVELWEDVPNKELHIGGELNNMMRSMLETPLYYSNSCMAMIACGQMLRRLYARTEGEECETYDQLIAFVRKNMRHNPSDPFACDCGHGGCSDVCKTLMSMIMEVPTVVHNQTYLLQILAYLMYDKSGREEVFINNLKNACSPGLLDRTPTRLAMLMGTLEKSEIHAHYRTIRRQMHQLNPLRGSTVYSKSALERLVQLANHPRMQSVIEALPGASAAVVELRLPKCPAGKRQCLNRDVDERTIARRETNNNGKNKCCGYLRQDPFDILVSSVSLTQLLVYAFTDPSTGPKESRLHYFVRDIVTCMAKQTVKINADTLKETFCYLDRTRVFKGFSEHPFMMSALQELFTAYVEYMKDAAEKYKENGKRRRMKRYLKRNGVPDGAV